MPLYEYMCSKCKEHVEVVQKVTDPPLKKCQKCGSALKKLISPSALQFKGNGWYITDYARKSTPEKEAPKSKEPSTSKTDGTESQPSNSSASD